jgi:hypothetical protein
LEFEVGKKKLIGKKNEFFFLFEDVLFEIKYYSKIHFFNVLPIIQKNIILLQVVLTEKLPTGKQQMAHKYENLKHQKVEQLMVLILIVQEIIL